MSNETAPVQAALNASEWKLIQELRALPESPLKGRVHEVLGELLFYVRNPRCQGVGVEGFPCGDPKSTCEDCHHIWDLLEQVGSRTRRNPGNTAV